MSAPRCPKCQADMEERKGKFGRFFGCTRYPQCKGTKQIPDPGEGEMKVDDAGALLAIGNFCRECPKRTENLAECSERDCQLYAYRDGKDHSNEPSEREDGQQEGIEE